MTEARTYMGGHTNLITPRDWQIQAQAEAADGYAARMAEARRYGAMAVALEAAQSRIDFKEMLIERDAALARLAEIEKQEPIYQYQRADGGWIDQTKNGYDYNVRYGAATVRILYAAAGASPVEPSESVEHRDELAKRKPEPAAETVGGLAKAVKAARGGDAPPAPMRRFA